MIEQFYLTHRCDPNRVKVGLRIMVMKEYSTFTKIQDWILTIT